MSESVRVAYTVEQCWHRVPGGSATAALEVARRLAERSDVELIPVAGRHRRAAAAPWTAPAATQQLPFGRPWLYETWNRWEWPKIERASGDIDVCHSTVAIPAATSAPAVVTVHDTAFIDAPERFTRRGARVMTVGLERCRSAELLLCPSQATADALAELGFANERLRVVPWGVEARPISDSDRHRARRTYDLPEEFVLFVGTLEPRKNLERLSAAMNGVDLPLVVAGASGWGDVAQAIDNPSIRFLGLLDEQMLSALYSMAAVTAYPSLSEGFGLPVAESMAYGTPVVTSSGTSTEEVAGGAAVLVDPMSVDSIRAGLLDALSQADRLRPLGLERAAQLSWDATVDGHVAAYRDAAR